MPFNATTYRMNRYRKDRDTCLQRARDAKIASLLPGQSAFNVQRAIDTVSSNVKHARICNNLFRSERRIKAIKTAPVSDFMPGGKFYEEPK